MSELLTIVEWEAYAILVALAAVVLVELWTGRIQTGSLIYGRTRGGRGYLSAARVQLLIVTIVTAAHYIGDLRKGAGTLPDIPKPWLYLVGASQVLYLTNKFQGKRNNSFHM